MKILACLAALLHDSAGVILRGSLNEPEAESSLLAADSNLLTATDGQEQCDFELYDPQDDVLRIVDSGKASLVFEQGDVFVVDGAAREDGTYQRYLTFRQAAEGGVTDSQALNNFFGGDGGAMAQMTRPKCREQVQVTCQKSASSKTASSSFIQGVRGCDSKLCQPNALDNMVPEYRALLGSALKNCGQLSKVLVLGFGAGIVPIAVAQSHPEATVESVDISPDVLAAASCFGVEPSDKMKLVESDGRAYLESVEDGSLDMLFVDIYDDKAHMPPCFTTVEFFATAKKKLSKEGQLAMNIVTDQLQDVVPSVVASFTDVKVGNLAADRGNNVLLASSSATGTATNSFLQASDDGSSSVFASWAQDASFAAASRSSPSTPRTDASYCK